MDECWLLDGSGRCVEVAPGRVRCSRHRHIHSGYKFGRKLSLCTGQCIGIDCTASDRTAYLRQWDAEARAGGLGDAVAAVAQPIARSIDWLLGTNLEGCGGCNNRREKLNVWGERLRSWLSGKQAEPVPLILDNGQSPGDVVVMTGVVHELHSQYPNRFLTDVRTRAGELWQENPHVTRLDDGIHLPVTYEGIHRSNQSSKHFMQAMADDLAAALGLPGLEIQEPRGAIYLNDEEKAQYPFEPHEPYWLVCSGVKSDYTCKAWPYYQDVVDALKGEVQFVQVGALDTGTIRHFHEPLEGVFNLLGQTGHRDLVHLVYHCQGVLSGVTYLMHLAAAFRKPCITLLGGREPLPWVKYPYDEHVVFDTIGQLDCCQSGGCWRSRVVPLNDGDEKDHSLCLRPIDGFPECMRMIDPQIVIEAVHQGSSCIPVRSAM